MNKGVHMPTFEVSAHGKLRVKTEFGEFWSLLLGLFVNEVSWASSVAVYRPVAAAGAWPVCEPYKTGWTDLGAISAMHSGGTKEPCIMWGPEYPRRGTVLKGTSPSLSWSLGNIWRESKLLGRLQQRCGILLSVLHQLVPSVLWRCWLGSRKGIRPVKTEWWGAGIVICLERGADLHIAQLMPLPLTVSCFRKIQIGFIFLVPAHLGSPGKRAVKWACVCVYFINLIRVNNEHSISVWSHTGSR